jgi:hypothetical protein
MKLFSPLLILLALAGCRPSLYSELERIRAEIKMLESDQRIVPDDAPIWVSQAEAEKHPELDKDDAFEKHIQDHTPTVPDFVYNHVMGRLKDTSDDVLRKMSAGDFPHDAALIDPAPFRGRLWRVVGVAVNLRHEKQPEGTAIPESYSGAAYAKGGQLILFHVIEKPDVLYLDQDTVEMVGVFVKLISVGPPNNRVSAPLFFARSLRKFL